MLNKDFEGFIFRHYDNDIEFVRELQSINPKWNDKKFSRIKYGQMPKLDDAVEMSRATGEPLAVLADIFYPTNSQIMRV